MSDRCSATITIGGRMTREVFLALARRIADEGLSTQWDGPWFSPWDAVPGEPLRLMAHDVAGGAFPELEAWCMARGLAFVRWRAACPGAWAARRVVYPGNDEPCCYVVGEEGEILIDAATVEDLGSIQAVGAYFAAAAFEAPPLVIVDPPGPGG